MRRTRDGWRVGQDEVPDLTCAMVLADLLAAELPPEPAVAKPAAPQAERARSGQAQSGQAQSGQAPAGKAAAAARPADGGPAGDKAASEKAASEKAASEKAAVSEAGRLRTTIGQLERALIARIRVEQAIGVLAERHRIQPRQAFEQLRSAARNRGRRVIDIAADVVASATNPLLQLPEELSRPRSAGRNRATRPHGALGSE